MNPISKSPLEKEYWMQPKEDNLSFLGSKITKEEWVEKVITLGKLKPYVPEVRKGEHACLLLALLASRPDVKVPDNKAKEITILAENCFAELNRKLDYLPRDLEAKVEGIKSYVTNEVERQTRPMKDDVVALQEKVAELEAKLTLILGKI